MAHFAKIENNIVTQVIVVGNQDIKNLQFPESERFGQQFIKSIGLSGVWLQTSYHGNFRGKFAGKDFLYSKELDAFIPPRPYDSWTLDTKTLDWVPPTPQPVNTIDTYVWNEGSLSWKKATVNYEPPKQQNVNYEPIPGEPDYEVE